MEPPPLYSENALDSQHPPIQPFELPPPYSVEEHDQATLIANEAPEMPVIPAAGPALLQCEQRPGNSSNRRSRSTPQRGRHSRRAARGVRPTDPTAHTHRHSSSRRHRHQAGRDSQNTAVDNTKNESQEAKHDNQEGQGNAPKPAVNNTDNQSQEIKTNNQERQSNYAANVSVVEVGIDSQGHQYTPLLTNTSAVTAAPEGGVHEHPSAPTENVEHSADFAPSQAETLNMDCVKMSEDIITDAKENLVSETCGESVA